MNSRLFFTCLSCAGLLLSGCNKSEPEAPAASAGKARPVQPPPPSPPPVPAGPSESEQKLAQQLREMQTRQLELELKLEDEKLARTEAEIAKERDLLEKERIAWNREQELAVAKLPPPETTEAPDSGASAGRNYDYQMFYDDLEPMGTWYDCEDYGYVWQPTVCVTDNTWRPYTLGSWANCDQGWAWCSDEPFGWACYHYGRWAQLRGRGWVWVPGDQWAPCWVSWRRNDNYIGWCPLPPETVYDRDCIYGPTIDRDCGIHPGWYVFMPVKHFDRPCRNYCEVPATCLTICSTTVCITNITIRPGRVDCHGPKYDWIRDSVRRPVPRYTLARETEFAGRGQRGPRLEKDKLRCYTPKVRAPWNTQLRPARHAALDSQEVVRAEGGLPEKIASRFRTGKQEREREVGSLQGSAKAIARRHQRLAALEQTRESLREQRARAQAGTGADVTDNAPARVERPERDGNPQSRPGRPLAGDAPSSRALAIPETTPSPVSQQPGRADVNARREPSAAEKTVTEKERRDAEAAVRRVAAANDKDREDERSSRRVDLEEKRRQQKEAGAARPQTAAQPGVEIQPRAAETAAHTESKARADAAAREMEKQAALRAQLEEKRRQQQAQNEQSQAQAAAAQRAAMEQRRASEGAARTETARNDAARRESDNQSAIRAAQEQQRRQADAEARAEQQARQREAMEQQRAATEQQRRQADAEARAEQQRRQAQELQRRQAEAESRQRQAQEEQRREAGEQQQRRQAEESQRRQAEAESRQREMEQRRQAEEQQQQRRQAEERAKEATEQQRRQAENQDREERGRGKR